MRQPVLNGLLTYLKLFSTAGRRRGKLGRRGARALRTYLGEREEGVLWVFLRKSFVIRL